MQEVNKSTPSAGEKSRQKDQQTNGHNREFFSDCCGGFPSARLAISSESAARNIFRVVRNLRRETARYFAQYVRHAIEQPQAPQGSLKTGLLDSELYRSAFRTSTGFDFGSNSPPRSGRNPLGGTGQVNGSRDSHLEAGGDPRRRVSAEPYGVG